MINPYSDNMGGGGFDPPVTTKAPSDVPNIGLPDARKKQLAALLGGLGSMTGGQDDSQPLAPPPMMNQGILPRQQNPFQMQQMPMKRQLPSIIPQGYGGGY